MLDLRMKAEAIAETREAYVRQEGEAERIADNMAKSDSIDAPELARPIIPC